MHWTKRLIVTLIFTLVVIVSLISWRIVTSRYHSKETRVLHLLKDRQEHLSNVWSKCFHSNRTGSCRDDLKSENGLKHPHSGVKNVDCPVGYIKQNGTCVVCPRGMFALEHWVGCVPHLVCDNLHYGGVQVGNVLYRRGNWEFHAARWNTYDVIYAVVIPSDDDLVVFDFESVKSLPPHNNLLYPIGMCNEGGAKPELLFAWNDVILGGVDDLDSILMRRAGCDDEVVRFKLAIDYVQILVQLHTENVRGTRHVLCNSHSLSFLLSQFLVSDDLRLILSTFDNLPGLSKDTKILCSQSELKGGFVAPEQRWPYQSSKVFNPTQQPGYTEKTDVWKIPDVTQALLGKSGEKIKNLLTVMHRKCKNLEPSKRPTALQVLHEYQHVRNMLGLAPLCQ